MTDDPNVMGEQLKPCPMGCVGEVIGGEHEAACVYCMVCHLRAVSPEAWNRRTPTNEARDARQAAIEEALGKIACGEYDDSADDPSRRAYRIAQAALATPVVDQGERGSKL